MQMNKYNWATGISFCNYPPSLQQPRFTIYLSIKVKQQQHDPFGNAGHVWNIS